MALITDPTNLDYLITPLRLHIGDIDELIYSDDELRTMLVYGVKALANRWNFRYLINSTTNNAERNPNVTFTLPEPPTIQFSDERPIVLQAAIDIKGSYTYSSSGDAIAWKDDEVQFSNISSAKFREDSLLRDIAELEALLPSARKRLVSTKKQSLVGFTQDVGNDYEG